MVSIHLRNIPSETDTGVLVVVDVVVDVVVEDTVIRKFIQMRVHKHI